MRELLWKIVAYLVSREPVADYLIRRSQRTPYTPIGEYMDRWWLFNPYIPDQPKKGWFKNLLPSIRVHHIKLPDDARHLHDHPWDARTIILRGYYVECKLTKLGTCYSYRFRGDTGAIKLNDFHAINEVSLGGVYTLFFTWKYMGTWGFLVDDKKIPYKEYLGQ